MTLAARWSSVIDLCRLVMNSMLTDKVFQDDSDDEEEDEDRRESAGGRVVSDEGVDRSEVERKEIGQI